MLSRQQELQQFSDGQPSNLPKCMSAKHAASGQYPNVNRSLFDASEMVASSNLNWTHQNVSSSLQGINEGSSYSHGGLVPNPSLQQPDMSLYGATNGRGDLGQYAPTQGVSYSSEEKPISHTPALANSFSGDKHSITLSHAHSMGGPFMLRQGLQFQGSAGQASIHMLNSGIFSQNLSQMKSQQNVTSAPEGEQPSGTFSQRGQLKQSTSDNLRAPVSPVVSMESQHSSQMLDSQPRLQVPDLAAIPVNDCVVLNNKNLSDIWQDSRSSNLSESGMIRNDYQFNQHAVDNLNYMPLDEKKVQRDYKSTSYDPQSSGNTIAVDMLYKGTAEIYGNRNSRDSYTSKLSQAYVAQKSHASFNAEDSEPSARSSHKPQNQAMCMLSPVANSQQECFSHFKSTNTFPTTSNSTIQDKPKMLADAFTKGSPASDISTSCDSQYTSEHDQEREPRDHGNTVQGFNVSQTGPQGLLNVSNSAIFQGATIPDRFYFQSPVQQDSRFVNFGYGRKGQTGRTPSCFGQSFSPMQGVSLSQSCADGKTAIKTSNLNMEKNSLEGTYHQDAKPISLLKHVRSQKDSLDLPSSFDQSSRSFAVGENSFDQHKLPMIENVVKGHESAENYLKISSNAPDYVGLPVKSGLAQRSFPETTTSNACPTYSQTQLLHTVENVNKQLDIADIDGDKVAYESAALCNLDKRWIHDIPGQRPVLGMHKPVKDTISSQSDSWFFGNESSNVAEVSTDASALQNMYSHKLPMRQDYSNGKVLYDQIRHLHMKAHYGPEVEYVQNEYFKNQQNNELLPGFANPIASSERSMPSSPPLLNGNEHLVLSRPKKRKTAMYECLPWCKEVMTTHNGPQDVSAAEEEWAKVTNQSIEKYLDIGERIEEIQPIVRAKRRLVVTTELMQLVFRPPPLNVLSVDSKIEYEIVVYSITKLALADACGLANITRANCNMLHDIGNLNSNGGMVNRLSDKATELLRRTKELETLLESLRSSKGISIVDISMECQELEKFGIINHFAKYHSRVPESKRKVTASSIRMASVRPFLQRYVHAVPVPRNLPEGIQCFSL